MLALLTFNKRLGWVVAACVAWSLIGLTVAAGMGLGRRPGDAAPFRLSMGLAQNSIIVDGQVLSIIESQEKLAINVLTRPGGKQQAYRPGGEVLSELPADLEIVFTTKVEKPGGRGQRPNRPIGPPEISLLGGAKNAREVAPKRWGVLTENYALKFAPGHLRIMPKPADAKPGWWRKFIQQAPSDKGRPSRPGDEMRKRRPGEKPLPGKGKRTGGGLRPPGGKQPGGPGGNQRPGPRPGGGKGVPPHGEGNGGGQGKPAPPPGGRHEPPPKG